MEEERLNDYDEDFVEEKLVKRTLMASAYPSLVMSYSKDGYTLYKGLLPGFDDVKALDLSSENECVEYLQDLLDDEVENLVVTGTPLPDVPSDEELLKQNAGYKIVYLDINVYVREDSVCDCHCEDCDSEECEFDDDYDDCGCGCDDCHCGDDCLCDGDCLCGDDCSCSCHDND